MTAASGDALSHVLSAMNPDAIFQAIGDPQFSGPRGDRTDAARHRRDICSTPKRMGAEPNCRNVSGS
jgi:hypothetical protein